jgi:RHS repeat-associated protein
VPASGSWQRLDVLLRDLGEGGDPIVTDLELVHVDGQVWFDRIGRMADCVAPAAAQPTVPTDEEVLIDDDAPSWITFESTSNTALGWTSAQAASGALSLVHPYRGQGTSVTGLVNVAQPLVSGSKLSLYALIDSCSTPVRQIHLRITTTSGSRTVSWGEPLWDIEENTIDKGPIPAIGTWTRLEVPLADLGLDSGTLTRLDIAHVDGRVWFDRIAFWPLTRAQLTSFVSDHESTVSVGTTVTWTATATGTVQPLQYRFERRDDLGNWSIVQNYGMLNTYTWTPTVADIGTNAVRVSVRNGGSTADFEDTATLLVRVVAGGEGLWLHNPNVRFAWWKCWFEPRVPASLGVHYNPIAATSEPPARRHTLYTPELQLLAQTEITTAATPAIAHEYVWFAGQPLAQIATTSGAIDWYFNDHLGTPILQTDADANLVWRVEYDPYGTAFSVRTGIDKHQPLRFPGQEDEGGEELAYNIHRWYRAEWGRYTQADPIALQGGLNLYTYVDGHPLSDIDPWGLYAIQDSIQLHASMNTEAICGSPFACSKIGATVGCVCDCDQNAGRVFASATLIIYGDLYYFNGPFSTKKQAAVDPTVKNASTAIAHEYNYHIIPAINAVDPLLTKLESTGFESTEKCQAECKDVAAKVNKLFSDTLKKTQIGENAK